MNVPTQVDFAQEVRSSRLGVLWKVTLAISVVLVWIALIATVLNLGYLIQLIVPVVCIWIGCVGCKMFLDRKRFSAAVWSYAAGPFVALALVMYTAPGEDPGAGFKSYVPFLFPMVIFIVGMLLPFRAAVVALIISVAITLIVPTVGHSVTFSGPQVLAICVMFASLAIAGQMSGELYGIAEWALNSYRKEREVAVQLFDSQQEIQRSLLRQKALTEKLEESNEELEKARGAAMEAKNFRGQFLANMSHELRTPLNAIIGFSDAMLNFPMLYQGQTLPTAYKQDLDQINTSGKHLLALINDILDLSKVDAGKLDLEMEQVDIDELFRGVMATAAGLKADKPIKLKRETPEPLPYVHGDSLRIRQIMLNLLSNSAKFTDEGSITVGAREIEGGEVMFYIADTGIGIPPQDMDKIFEEFRQGTSGRRKGRAGSGLGLAISRQLLNLMGGRIWAESTLGKGSTFYFTLPIYVPELAQAVEQES